MNAYASMGYIPTQLEMLDRFDSLPEWAVVELESAATTRPKVAKK